LVTIDCPNNEVALSIAAVAAAGGSVTDTKTTVAMATKEAMAAFKPLVSWRNRSREPGADLNSALLT
jgi:hypothetical protein